MFSWLALKANEAHVYLCANMGGTTEINSSLDEVFHLGTFLIWVFVGFDFNWRFFYGYLRRFKMAWSYKSRD